MRALPVHVDACSPADDPSGASTGASVAGVSPWRSGGGQHRHRQLALPGPGLGSRQELVDRRTRHRASAASPSTAGARCPASTDSPWAPKPVRTRPVRRGAHSLQSFGGLGLAARPPGGRRRAVQRFRSGRRIRILTRPGPARPARPARCGAVCCRRTPVARSASSTVVGIGGGGIDDRGVGQDPARGDIATLRRSGRGWSTARAPRPAPAGRGPCGCPTCDATGRDGSMVGSDVRRYSNSCAAQSVLPCSSSTAAIASRSSSSTSTSSAA